MIDSSQALPDRDFRFQMRFEKGTLAEFYGPSPDHESILGERRRWIEREPSVYLAVSPESRSLMEETLDLAREHAGVEGPAPTSKNAGEVDQAISCRFLGENWEPDFLLLSPDDEGIFRLRGGCLCFPSHWDLNEKMNQPLTAIHGPVPGLNDQLASQIDAFLQRIPPGISWERANWGLARTPELNLHPSREFPRLDSSVPLDEVWWRLEKQSLIALPDSGGVLFGIRLEIRPLREIQESPDSAANLIRALQTMPEAMARYKGLASARERLISLLQH